MTDDPVLIPQNLKLRLEKCPKCAYERQATDNQFASAFECPQCGVVYALAMEEVKRRNLGQQLQDEAEVAALKAESNATGSQIPTPQVGGAVFIGKERSSTWIVVLILVACCVGLAFFIL